MTMHPGVTRNFDTALLNFPLLTLLFRSSTTSQVYKGMPEMKSSRIERIELRLMEKISAE